jgi:flagellar biosynthesis protein FlhF
MNLLYKKKIALSYVTNGQSVPDDITPASYPKLVEMLLR